VVKFDLQLYKLENNSYLVDFKNAGTIRTGPSSSSPPQQTSVIEDYPFKLLENHLQTKLVDDPSPYLARWQIEDDQNVEHVQSVYPFLDVCSKLITDIV
jgi:carbon catabolite-derepressing protein kinase